MALRNVVKHYVSACDMPSCICLDGEVAIPLLPDELTTDGFPYFFGTVTIITENATGGFDVTIQYDDTTLPLVEGVPLVPVFPAAGEEGNVCDPVCAGPCDWFTLVRRMIDAGGSDGLISRGYQLYEADEDVADGVFLIPRIPFEPGYRMTDLRLTCFTYDINTTGTFTLKVGGVNVAQFIGNLAEQRQMTILVPDLLNDELPELHITGLTNGVYGVAAAGLVIEFIGILIPSP